MKKTKKFILIISLILLSASFLALITVQLILSHQPSDFCPHPSFSSVKTEPTCDKGGFTVYTCEKCQYSYVSDFTSPTPHDLQFTRVEPTCYAEGYTLYYCKCGYSFRASATPPTPHEIKSVSVSSDCTNQGYTVYTCEKCGYNYKGNYTEPAGHTFSASIHRPTALEAGYTEYTCACSYSYKGDYIYYSDILESAYTDNTVVLSKGIDVSRWNHRIDAADGEYIPLNWKEIKAQGIDFVILKAGSTKSGIEPTFEMDYEGARAAGLQIGAYFYTYSSSVTGISKDADMLLSWLEGKQFEYPIYLDIEDASLTGLGKNHLSAMCEAFLCKLQENGYYTGLYTNHTWLTTILDTARMVTLFDIWYARYPLTEKPVWNEEKYGRQLGMWQYSQSGNIIGEDGDFDMNYSYKNYAELMKKWHLNGF